MTPKNIHVNTDRSYDIAVGRGLLDEAGALIRPLTETSRAAVVTDSNVASLYGKRLLDSLKAAGFEALMFVFPAGEKSKNHETSLIYIHFLRRTVSPAAI